MRKKYWQNIAANLFLWSILLVIPVVILIIASLIPVYVNPGYWYDAAPRLLSATVILGGDITAMLISGGLALILGKEQHDLPEVLDEPIETDHGASLSTVMEALRNELVEYKAVFDSNGDKLAEGSILSPSSCKLTDEAWTKVCGQVKIDLHNHPNLSEGSFSPQDFRCLVACQSRQNIVVTFHYTYIMDASQSDLFMIDADEVKQYADTLYQEVEKNAIVRLSLTTGIFEHFIRRLCSVLVSHKVANRYGWKFRVEPAWFTRLRTRQFQINAAKLRKIALAGVICAILLGTHIDVSTSTSISNTTTTVKHTNIGPIMPYEIVGIQVEITKEAQVNTRYVEDVP